MVCTTCGALIPEHSFKCPGCGRAMNVSEVLESPPALERDDHYEGVGGWLGVLVFYLLVLLPLGLALGVARASGFLSGSWYSTQVPLGARIVYWVAAGLSAVLGIYAGLALWKILPNAVRATKFYLFVSLLATVIISLIAYQDPRDQVEEILWAAMWFLIWYAYLVRSKRVENTYGDA